ncbi:Electron transfer flavoprotein subunit beta [wastewater metagenome]|uniref:Electron transfer flavoprotein subunit beta n=2 Tax=unclassified sequences TaxID=12908 RepID=A0A5B8REP6_9ZZZZ|nr:MULTISPECIES: electron transfer flavoprotein subunit beta/FixA family protein [Arhodomonas]QEA06513.1 electron transfer flavoprotein subunit beta [uncultured organism]
MKVLVTAKRVVDHNVRVRVRPDGSGVDTASVKMSMNPFDEIAVEAAVRLREAGQADEVVVVSIGEKAVTDVIRTALALGADRGIHVDTDAELQPPAVSRALAELAVRETPDLILMGKQAIDDDSNQTAQMLAGRLGWGQGTFACGIEPADGEVIVAREVDGGTRRVALRLPAVVTADLRLNEPRYVKLPDIMKAKRKPLEAMSLADLGVAGDAGLTLLGVSEPPGREPGVRVADAAELAARLRDEAQVI